MPKKKKRKEVKPVTTQKTYWFVTKEYGYGWQPATWQGWVIMLFWIGAFVGIFIALWTIWWALILASLGLIFTLYTVIFFTGEPPRWRWGK